MGGMKNLSTDPVTDGASLTPVERTFFDDLVKSAEQPQTNEDEMVEGQNDDQHSDAEPAKPKPTEPLSFSSAARQ